MQETQETQVRSLGWEDLLEKGMATHSSKILPISPIKFHEQRSLAGYSPWSCKKSDTTERLRAHTHTHSTHIWLDKRNVKNGYHRGQGTNPFYMYPSLFLLNEKRLPTNRKKEREKKLQNVSSLMTWNTWYLYVVWKHYWWLEYIPRAWINNQW